MRTTFNSSTHMEFSGIVSEIITITQASSVPDIATQPLFAEVVRLYPEFHNVVERDAFTGLGEHVRGLNNERITASNSLKAIVKGHTRFSDQAKKEAATALLNEWDKLGTTSKTKDYDVANGYMSKVTNLLTSAAMKPHLETLALTTEATEVCALDKTFREAFSKQEVGNAALRDEDSATKRRPQLAKAVTSFLQFINAMRKVKGYDTLYSQLNEVVKTAQRTAKKEEGNPEEEAAEGTTNP